MTSQLVTSRQKRQDILPLRDRPRWAISAGHLQRHEIGTPHVVPHEDVAAGKQCRSRKVVERERYVRHRLAKLKVAPRKTRSVQPMPLVPHGGGQPDVAFYPSAFHSRARIGKPQTTAASDVVRAFYPDAIALLQSSPRVDADGAGLLNGPSWTRGFRCRYNRGADGHSRDQKDHPHCGDRSKRRFRPIVENDCHDRSQPKSSSSDIFWRVPGYLDDPGRYAQQDQSKPDISATQVSIQISVVRI